MPATNCTTLTAAALRIAPAVHSTSLSSVPATTCSASPLRQIATHTGASRTGLRTVPSAEGTLESSPAA
eukprot:5843416-Prymnesium_polylepis.2